MASTLSVCTVRGARAAPFKGSRLALRASATRMGPRLGLALTVMKWKLDGDVTLDVSSKMDAKRKAIGLADGKACAVKLGAIADVVDLMVDMDTVSGMHAELTEDGAGDLFVKDLDSTNGTFVNDKKVGEKVKLSPGDKVSFGGDNVFTVTQN